MHAPLGCSGNVHLTRLQGAAEACTWQCEAVLLLTAATCCQPPNRACELPHSMPNLPNMLHVGIDNILLQHWAGPGPRGRHKIRVTTFARTAHADCHRDKYHGTSSALC
jgi:hypothetical protein